MPVDNTLTEDKAALGRRLLSLKIRWPWNNRSVSCATCRNPTCVRQRPHTGRRRLEAIEGERRLRRRSSIGDSDGFTSWTAVRRRSKRGPSADRGSGRDGFVARGGRKRLNDHDIVSKRRSKRVGKANLRRLGRALATYLFPHDSFGRRAIRSLCRRRDRRALVPTAAWIANLPDQGPLLHLSFRAVVQRRELSQYRRRLAHRAGRSDGYVSGRWALPGLKSREDRGRFKTPTLREIARTAPYMHDGSLATLADVVDFYDRGGRPNPNLFPAIGPLNLSAEEKQALIAFLESLSGVVTGQ